MNLTTDEQEVVINGMRNDSYVTLYASDSIWITKMNKLVAQNPELFKIIKETEWGNTYQFPKKLLSIRKSITTRVLTEEQRNALRERLQKSKQKSK